MLNLLITVERSSRDALAARSEHRFFLVHFLLNHSQDQRNLMSHLQVHIQSDIVHTVLSTSVSKPWELELKSGLMYSIPPWVAWHDEGLE
mmetsp:Transcript_37471/g.69732  ORF Transcript_37471/g.69732 Transcript_37471/m.69732 type:complete len:90 (+) Transcript_37471:131-400(+)